MCVCFHNHFFLLSLLSLSEWDMNQLQEVNESYMWIPTANISHFDCYAVAVVVAAATAERCAKCVTFHATCLHMQCNFPFELLTLVLRNKNETTTKFTKTTTITATERQKTEGGRMCVCTLRMTTCTSHSIWWLWHLFRHCINYAGEWHCFHFSVL